jgi:hypothetical protein
MRSLGKWRGKTKRDRIRNQATRMGLGIIPLKEMIELTQLRWFGRVIRMGDERYPKMAWQARTQRKRPKGRHRQYWEEGTQRILKERGIEWNGVTAIARDCERWKALFKPSTPTGTSTSTGSAK